MPRKTYISNDERCKGIKTDGERCTRRHMPDKEYCKSHLRVNNMVLKQNTGKETTEPVKKRGRKPKFIPDEKIYKPDLYIPVNYCIIEGKKYLLDYENNVYSNNIENPVFIGKKTVYGIKIESPF